MKADVWPPRTLRTCAALPRITGNSSHGAWKSREIPAVTATLIPAGRLSIDLKAVPPADPRAGLPKLLLKKFARPPAGESGRRFTYAAAMDRPWTAFAAVRMTSMTRSGWESIGTWLLSSS
jgi:hypothetical protein